MFKSGRHSPEQHRQILLDNASESLRNKHQQLSTYQGDELIHYLVRSLSESDANVRRWALAELTVLSPSPQAMIPAILALLADDDVFVRWDAAASIPFFVRDHKEIETYVRSYSTHPNPSVRVAAYSVIFTSAVASNTSSLAFIRGLLDESSEVREYIGQAIRLAPPSLVASPECVHILAQVARADDEDLRSSALWGIGLGQIYSMEAIQSCVASLSATSQFIQLAALRALMHIGQQGQVYLDLLVPFLAHSDQNMRVVAAQVIASMGGDAHRAIPALTQAFAAAPTRSWERLYLAQALTSAGFCDDRIADYLVTSALCGTEDEKVLAASAMVHAPSFFPSFAVALARSLDTEPDQWVREKLSGALAILSGHSGQ